MLIATLVAKRYYEAVPQRFGTLNLESEKWGDIVISENVSGGCAQYRSILEPISRGNEATL